MPKVDLGIAAEGVKRVATQLWLARRTPPELKLLLSSTSSLSLGSPALPPSNGLASLFYLLFHV